MTLVDMTKYNGVPLTSICSGALPGGGSYTIQVNTSADFILVSKQSYEQMCEDNKQLCKMIAELETQTGHAIATALTAFMGWLTSRDEVTKPLSARHNAAQAARLVGEFCDAQGWKIDDARFGDDIRALKHKYPS